MSTSSPLSPDLPELRLVCQLAGLKPSAMTAALNSPEHFSRFVSAEELLRYLKGVERLMALISRIDLVLGTELERTLKEKANAR